MTHNYSMRSMPLAWWRKATDHRIYPRSFKDTNQDANDDIRAIMDLLSHSNTDEPPWFIESRESNDSLQRDGYIWRNGCKDALNSIYGKALKNVASF